MSICEKGIGEIERIEQVGLEFFDVYSENRDIEKSQSPSNALKTPVFRFSKMDKVELSINVKGREKHGIIAPGNDYQEIKKEIIDKLSGLKDPKTGEIAITEMFDNEDIYNGPYTNNGPDLVSGYNVGYRISWDGANGIINGVLFEDNTKAWSGDHCIDPRLVPGVIFSNRKIAAKKPALIDIAPTVLNLFGVKVPAYMEGNQIFGNGGNGRIDAEFSTEQVPEKVSQAEEGPTQ